MSRAVAPSAHRPYGVQRVTQVWGASRATVYRHRCGEQRPRSRPGPVGPLPDEAVVEASRALLAASPFHGGGDRKIWARRLAPRGDLGGRPGAPTASPAGAPPGAVSCA